MASSPIFPEKHIAAMEELKAELEDAAHSDAPQFKAMECSMLMAAAPGADAKSQATTRAAMLNDGVGAVTLLDKKDWSGKVLGTYPPSITVSRSGKASHRGVPPVDSYGSKAAVVYVGPNVQGGPSNCAWILAWSVPGDGSPNKVYVETGPSTKYPKGNINWDEIKTKLESSTNQSYAPPDEGTGAQASAQIDDGNFPPVAAVFDVTL